MKRLMSLLAVAALFLPAFAFAQMGGFAEAEKLVRISAPPVVIAAGTKADATVTIAIESGWHINANPPSPDYMIPTQVEVAPRYGVSAGKPAYPLPKMLKVAFDDKELFVYDTEAAIRVPLEAGAKAVNGTHTLKGTLRFQACNDEVCLAPTSVPFTLEVTVQGGVDASAAIEDTAAAPTAIATPETTSTAPAPMPTGGFATAPPAGGATIDNPLARQLDRGGWAAFLTLFFIGLALNLTPCVYPMLGVTVSIFGARRAAPPLQVFGYAVVYVLGMAAMYSTLGLLAAFTGGLFGGFLQSPIVLVLIGVLLLAMSLSMFGFYELQLPAVVREKLGGTSGTSLAGVFASGLAVGVFAAPCVGPPVVALLAVVGAKGDPWFGFTSFFVLALGLGVPYLLLGTFSNLLQTMPRSGEWMVWVKKLFGVVLVGLGAFYVLLAVAPSSIVWVAPAAMILGGIYLGFIDRSGGQKPAFRRIKWGVGALGVIMGVTLIATTPRQGLALEPFSEEKLAAAFQSGKPAMIDFSANWCVPCHELERYTFSDRRVISMASGFGVFKVDLTRYDSPEADSWRKRHAIRGVPTVLFLAPDGTEVQGSRVEGFLPAEQFLDRMRTVAETGRQAARE